MPAPVGRLTKIQDRAIASEIDNLYRLFQQKQLSGTAVNTRQLAIDVGKVLPKEALRLLDDVFRKGQAPWTPGTVSDGDFLAINVPAAGAEISMPCVASFSLPLPDGVFLTASVNAPGNVRVALRNESGSSQNLGLGTVRVLVINL